MLLLALVCGGMLYVTFLIAPIIFIVLEDPEATQFTRKLWPNYFLLNAGGTLGIGLVITIFTPWVLSGYFILTVAGLMIINWLLALRMQEMREPGSEYVEGSTYDWYHSLTVWSNAFSIILISVILVHFIAH